MRIAKVYSKVLNKALDSGKFWNLHLYTTSFWKDEDGCFISKVVDFDGKPTLELKLALEDYFFNEYWEAQNLFDFANDTIGEKKVDLKCLKVVEL